VVCTSAGREGYPVARITVMLTTEGTYPFHLGGVSTWCDILVHRVPQVSWVIYAVMMNPFVTQKYRLPPSVRRLIKVPLWGTEEPSEPLEEIPFSRVYDAKRRTDERVVREHFLPLFRDVLEEILDGSPQPRRLGRALSEMYRYFREYDYHRTFKTRVVWETFRKEVLRRAHGEEGRWPVPTLYDVTETLGWLYRFFIVLNIPLPEADVAHSAAAAFCGIPCVVAKQQMRIPYLLTEHGVYLREQYLSASKALLSTYSKTFLLNLVRAVVRLNYEFADQISPVCAYNTRWERELGVRLDKIRVIYNGVDPDLYRPRPEVPAPSRPTVVTVARIDPVKDILTLIRAAAVVRDTLPDVKFVVYGSVAVPSYYDECLTLRHQLGLEDTVIFAGHTDDVPAAYQSGDVVCLSSLSEGFPYSVIEAMMSGKAIVATDVGGVREALGDAGVVVRPQDPEGMAAALLRLLRDPGLRATLGEEARQRALNYFSVAQVVKSYLEAYLELYERRAPVTVTPARTRQRLHAQRGYALAEIGAWKEAAEQFALAVECDPSSPAAPLLLAEVARALTELGQFDRAMLALEKAEALAELLDREVA